jgi:hypothetical protein
MHFAANSAGTVPRWLSRNSSCRRNCGRHRGRCTSVPIPLSPVRSDTGGVGTYLTPLPVPPSPAPVAQWLAGHNGQPPAGRDVDATGWRAGTPAAHAGGMPTSFEGRKRALPVSDAVLARHHRSVAFDRLLESVHREHLGPFELRVLLRVTDREATVGDLAESMGQPPERAQTRERAPRRARSTSASQAPKPAPSPGDHPRDNRVRDECAESRDRSA